MWLIIVLVIVKLYRLVPVLFTPVQQFHPTCPCSLYTCSTLYLISLSKFLIMLRRIHMKLIVIRFQCSSEANRIECTSDAHWSHSHGTTGNQIRSELWRAWVSQITAKGYKMLQESISVYKDTAGRCSEGRPTHVALRAACVRRSKVAQWNHWDYFILLYCNTLLSF